MPSAHVAEDLAAAASAIDGHDLDVEAVLVGAELLDLASCLFVLNKNVDNKLKENCHKAVFYLCIVDTSKLLF